MSLWDSCFFGSTSVGDTAGVGAGPVPARWPGRANVRGGPSADERPFGRASWHGACPYICSMPHPHSCRTVFSTMQLSCKRKYVLLQRPSRRSRVSRDNRLRRETRRLLLQSGEITVSYIEAIKMRIMNRRIIFSIVVMLTAWGATVSAQSLAECIATAREHNIGMQVADLQVQRARRMEGSYFEIERTELSLSQDPTSGGSPDNALTLSQRFDFPTVYGSRRKMLKAETEVEASRRRLTESELTRDVSSAYSTLLYWQHIEALLCQNDSVLTAFVTTADVRFRNGETNRLELMNAQRMKAENTMQLQEAQKAKRAAARLDVDIARASREQAERLVEGGSSWTAL